MTLKDYLAQQNLSLKAFGESCGLSAATVSRARDNLHMPSRKTLTAIVNATGGHVSVQDLLIVEPLPKGPHDDD